MKISTKLRIGIQISIVLAGIFLGVIFYLAFALQVVATKGHMADQISDTSFQLSLLRSEYVSHPGERAKSQWIHMYEMQSRSLDQAMPYFSSTKERKILVAIRQASDELGALFGELVKSIENGSSPTVIEELGNQMTIQAQTRVVNASLLSEIGRKDVLRTSQEFIVVIMLFLVVIIITKIVFLCSVFKITDAFRVLGEETRVIAAGDLTHQLDIHSTDEIGDLARLFNAMAEELRISREKLEQKVTDRSQEISTILGALDKVALVSMTDVKGDIVYVNDRFVEVSKYDRSELIGSNHRILKSGQQPKELFDALWSTISNGRVWRGEIMNRAKDGTYYWVDTAIAPVLNKRGKPERYISVRFLITEQKQTMQDLRNANSFLDAILQNIPLMVFIKDAKELRFLRLNKAGEEQLGYSHKDLFGKSDLDFFPKEQAEFFIEKDRAVLESDEVVDIPEEPIQTQAHGERWLHTRKVRVCDDHGDPLYLLGISEDITDRKRIDSAKSEFVALVSHQLRTPLTEIRWALSAMCQDVRFDQKYKKMITTAHAASVNMAETIHAMLTIAHIESGTLSSQKHSVHIRDVLEATIQLLDGMRERRSLRVRVECPDTLIVLTDEQILKEILSNLLTNAYKYSPSKGTVVVRVTERDSMVRIEVEDTGYGIPDDEQSRIFQKFFRASNITGKEEAGTGLGLYLVYSLASILDGSVSFLSKENVGTTFTFAFPSVES